MNYTQEEFFDLIEAVENQGGTLQTEMCRAKKYTFSGDNIKPVTFAGCGNQSLFEVPDIMFAGADNVGKGTTVVCAVDDEMGRWPRFGGDRFATEGGEDDG